MSDSTLLYVCMYDGLDLGSVELDIEYGYWL